MDLDTIFTFLYLLVLPFMLCIIGSFVISRLPLFDSGTSSICVLVLGDIGRSPRMQYHSMSFAQSGYHVDVVAYKGTVPHQDFVENQNIKMHFMKKPPDIVQKFPSIIAKILKGLWQAVVLFLTLFLLKKTHVIFIQNPPAIPSLAIALITSVIKNNRVVIDWHNYGYTILGLSLGDKHPLVKISKWYEQYLGKFASANFCVTKAMRRDLKENWGVTARTMYDRPPAMFVKTSLEDRHNLFLKLAKNGYPCCGNSNGNEKETAFTIANADSWAFKDDRPAILISSTSWTDDEDFSILLNALDDYEMKVNRGNLPQLVCVITGKGPRKAEYQSIISLKDWKNVKVITPWLEAEDYPCLLGSADLGVCLHTSSSGLDLPMKVVDMFGCGLPVCAINFFCLDELVKHDVNGLIFNNSQELSTQIQDLLSDFPKKTRLENFENNLKNFQSVRWDQNWNENVLPVIKELLYYAEDRL